MQIVRYKELLNKQQENRNIIVTDKSAVGKICIAGLWKKSTKHKLIHTSFKKSAQSLSDKIDTLGSTVGPTEIEEFVESGLEHPELSKSQRSQLSTNYSIQLN